MMSSRRALSFVVLASALTACGGDDPATPKSPALSYTHEALFERGPYPVGFRETSVPYVAAGGQGEERKPTLRIWYPAALQGEPSAVYKLAGILKLPVRDVSASPALAPVGPDATSSFPVAVYSHGSGGDSVLAYPFAEQLASRGWVVVSVEHPGNSARELAVGKGRTLLEAAVYRPVDVRRALDAAETGFEFEGWNGRLRADRVFLFGHSFGGYTSLVLGGATPQSAIFDMMVAERCGDQESIETPACQFLMDADVRAAFSASNRDTRVAAIGLQAASTLDGLLDAATVDVPTLMLSGDLDITTPHVEDAEPIWAALSASPRQWVRFGLGGHMSFITMCDDLPASLLTSFQPTAMDDGCGESFRASADIIEANTAFLTAFAEQQIRGVKAWDDALVDGTIDPDDGTSVIRIE